ncbi:MAG: hypothetical protein ACR2IR_08860 [Acidimicrobiia bacterium]
MMYSGPVETVYGPAMLEGGENGRTLEINPGGTFAFHDTGAEDTRFSLTADVTSLSGTLTATTSDGQVLDIPLPPDAAGVEETFGFTPDAGYTCEGDEVTIRFQVLTLTLDRQ